MNLIELHINGISYSQTENGAYALILSESEGERKLPIVIGTNEAQSIAIAIEKEIKPPRPLTHDLFKNFCNIFDIKIKKVIISFKLYIYISNFIYLMYEFTLLNFFMRDIYKCFLILM